jgi:protein-disulfide isomerase
MNALHAQMEELIKQAESCTDVVSFGATKAKLHELIQTGQSPPFAASAALQTAISGFIARLTACEDALAKSQAAATAQAQVCIRQRSKIANLDLSPDFRLASEFTSCGHSFFSLPSLYQNLNNCVAPSDQATNRTM